MKKRKRKTYSPKYLENVEMKSKLRAAQRLPRTYSVEEHRMLLDGTSRYHRTVDPASAAAIARIEARARDGSLKLEMIERVKRLFAETDEPIPTDDIHALVTEDYCDLPLTDRAIAYITNNVAWGLGRLGQLGLIDKLDGLGNVMRLPDGRVDRRRGKYYVAV